MPAMRLTRSEDARKSTGTSTARASNVPQSATTHSGRFSLQTTTLSSAPIPRAARAAANVRAAAPISRYVMERTRYPSSCTMKTSSCLVMSSKKSRSVWRAICGDIILRPHRMTREKTLRGSGGNSMTVRMFGKTTLVAATVLSSVVALSAQGQAGAGAPPAGGGQQGNITLQWNDKIPAGNMEHATKALAESPRHGEWVDIALPGGGKLNTWV